MSFPRVSAMAAKRFEKAPFTQRTRGPTPAQRPPRPRGARRVDRHGRPIRPRARRRGAGAGRGARSPRSWRRSGGRSPGARLGEDLGADLRGAGDPESHGVVERGALGSGLWRSGGKPPRAASGSGVVVEAQAGSSVASPRREEEGQQGVEAGPAQTVGARDHRRACGDGGEGDEARAGRRGLEIGGAITHERWSRGRPRSAAGRACRQRARGTARSVLPGAVLFGCGVHGEHARDRCRGGRRRAARTAAGHRSPRAPPSPARAASPRCGPPRAGPPPRSGPPRGRGLRGPDRSRRRP